jgi:hypothetical protein
MQCTVRQLGSAQQTQPHRPAIHTGRSRFNTTCNDSKQQPCSHGNGTVTPASTADYNSSPQPQNTPTHPPSPP